MGVIWSKMNSMQKRNEIFLTKNEQKKMNDTKYAYAIGDPQSSPCLPDLESHGPLRHANIMFGQASPVAHLF